MNSRVICSVVILAIIVACAGTAGAEDTDQPWQVTADRILHFKNPDCLVAEGNVVMSRKNTANTAAGQEQAAGSSTNQPAAALKPMTITGDWLRLEPGNIVKVRGHAVLDSEDEHITADSARLNIDNHTGILHKATLYFPQRHVYLAGEQIEKTGELTYHLEDGWVTKCAPKEGKAPPWSFGWSKAMITQEGFAHFMNATLRVKDVPVIYSPYFGFSTSQQRKTGFLMPEFSQGERDGTGILVPFFINLSPSQDLTLYGGGKAKRGVIGGAKYRYVLDENSKGIFALNYMHDRLQDTPEDDYKSDGIFRSRQNRYWFRGKVDEDFGNNWQGKMDLDLVSDRDYLEEYDDGMLGFIKSDAEFKQLFNRGFDSETTYVRYNTAQLAKFWSDMSLNTEMSLVQDLTSTPSTQHLWTLPRVTFAGSHALLQTQDMSTPTGLRAIAESTDLLWNTELVNYWREAGVGGRRLDLHPQLTAPLRVTPYLETTATMGVRETLYNVDDNRVKPGSYGDGILTRYLYDFNLSTSTIFMRDFNFEKYSSRLTHMIRPNLSYDYIPYKRQTYLPSMDVVDRIGPQNLITYGIDNDFFLSPLLEEWDMDKGRRLAYSKISQSYDLREASRDLAGPNDHHRPFSAVYIEAGLYPLQELSFLYKTNWDVYHKGILNYELTSTYSDADGDNLSFGYRYYPAQTVNQINFDATKKLTETLLAQGIFDHSLSYDETSTASLRVLYNPACWALEMLASTATNEDYRFTILFSLEGVGNIIGLHQSFRTTRADAIP